MKPIPFIYSFSLAVALAARAAAPVNPAIEAAMSAEVASHHAAGVVTLVMQEGRVIHHVATGFADREQRRPMKPDSVFWIASMTKSLSTTAIMTLVDEGKLSLDGPASKWLPELGRVRLANGQPPARPITLRDLMSHTAGIAFPPRKPTDGAHSLKSYTAELLKAPLAFEPGSAYEYGFGITIAGRIAEIVTGKPFDVFMQERLLDLLGMRDTAFHPSAKLRSRIARTYKTGEDGGLELAYNSFVTSDPAVRRMTEPSGGLFSTAADLAKFYQMILNGGVHDGRRIVSEKSIAEMTRPHRSGEKTFNYGLGWQTGNGEKPAIAGFSNNAFGHGGAFATHGFIDPERRLVTVFLVQNVLVNGSGEARKAFHDAVNRALVPVKP
ncbi:MAG: beta-lactamase family protein [Verrucomicrobiae bacterium]|nr:beta-lactamase family protein [Verrucomicrobiae bacterium]